MDAREAQKVLYSRRKNCKVALKDIAIVINCKDKEDWTAAENTKLYKLHGGAFCELLEILN